MVRILKRSVYSLVLSDDVIEAIDNMAYSLGTSRSNLINQILAEKVSLITPEKRIKNIFKEISNSMVEDCYQVQAQQSDTLLSIRSSLKYKYRPTVRYSVELFRNSNQGIGQLKVIFRTQNQVLLQMVDNFFNVWAELESRYIQNKISYLIEEGRFTRLFTSTSSSDVGVAISEYIRTFDTTLKQYFSNPNDITSIENMYKKYLSQGILIV